MSWIPFFHLLTFLISIFLGFLSIYKNKENKVNKIFLLFVLTIAAWSFIEFQYNSTTDIKKYIFWRSLDVFWIFTTISILHFTLAINNSKILRYKWILITLYIIGFISAVIDIFLISPIEVKISKWGFFVDVYSNEVKIFYYILRIFFSLVAFLSIIVCLKYIVVNKDRRLLKSLFLLLIGLSIPVIFGIIVEVIIPIFSHIIMPLSATTSFIFVNIFLGYIIWKHNVLEITPEIAANEILQTMSDIVILTDERGIIKYANTALKNISGYKIDDILNKNINDILKIKNTTFSQYLLKKKINRKKILNFEANIILKKSNNLPVLASLNPFSDKKNVLKGYILVIKDIKEQKEIEIKLRKEKEYSDLLFQLTPSGIFFIDKEKTIRGWNKKAEKITGYSKEEIIGQKSTLFLEPPINKIDEDFSQYINVSKDNEECVIITKDGNKKTIIKNMYLLYDENNNIIGTIESFNDITEVKKLEEFKDTIEKTLRHDLKNSLSAIIGYPSLILKSNNLTNNQKEMLNLIIEASNLMLNQIDLYLNIFKIEQNKYVFKPYSVDIVKLTKKVCFNLKNKAIEKNILIELLIDESSDNFIYMLDEILYYSMLLNIVKNAIEASPEGKSISVKIYTKEKLKIIIHNQGVIPFDIRPQFFNKFSTHGKKDGLGLGAYSAKIMAEVMGGEISFETDEQEGTSIIVIFNK